MTIELSAELARRQRWRSHLLGGSDLTPTQVVARAVALQGQDLPAVLRAIALRSIGGTTLSEVRSAFDRGELVRSWPMRGTLFATTPRHLADLLSLTAERSHRAAARRREQLGLDDAIIELSGDVLREGLAECPLSRSATLALWNAAGIDTSDGRGYHLIAHHAIDGLIHWGRFDAAGGEQLLTLTVVTEPSPAPLVPLLRSFVEARGPVTEADAAWWWKLPKTLVREAARQIDDLTEVRVDGAPAWMIGEPGSAAPSGVTLVPGFDEWILGYADRSLVALPEVLASLVPGGNGIFRPAVLVDGAVVGTWRLPPARARGAVREPVLDLVVEVSASTRAAIDDALAAWPYA